MLRPLWQILIGLVESESHLTCVECFAVLNYYADQLEAGVDPDALHGAVTRHLTRRTDHKDAVFIKVLFPIASKIQDKI